MPYLIRNGFCCPVADCRNNRNGIHSAINEIVYIFTIDSYSHNLCRLTYYSLIRVEFNNITYSFMHNLTELLHLCNLKVHLFLILHCAPHPQPTHTSSSSRSPSLHNQPHRRRPAAIVTAVAVVAAAVTACCCPRRRLAVAAAVLEITITSPPCLSITSPRVHLDLISVEEVS